MNYKVSKKKYYKTTTNNTTTLLLIAMTMFIIFGSSSATIDKIQMVYAADILLSDNKINNDYQIVNVLFTDRSRNIESDCSDGVDNDNDGLIDQDDTDDCPE